MPVSTAMRAKLASTSESSFLTLYDPELTADEEGDYGPTFIQRYWPLFAAGGAFIVIVSVVVLYCKKCCCKKKGDSQSMQKSNEMV